MRPFIEPMKTTSDNAPEFTVHVHGADVKGFLTNAFLVEMSRSIVAVDALMRISDARGLREKCEAPDLCASAIG